MPQVIDSLPHIFRFVVDSNPPRGFLHSWSIIDPKDQILFKVVTNLPGNNSYDRSATCMPMTQILNKHGVFAKIDWYNPLGTCVQVGHAKDMEGVTRLPPANEKALVIPSTSRWQPIANWLTPLDENEIKKLKGW
jgi:hypothetical protein